MPYPKIVPFLSTLFVASVAVAQSYIVDSANRPGTNYTEISTAVAAVPDGAVLQVRDGTYVPFQIRNKSLAVLCEPGALISSNIFQPTAIDIVDLDATKTVTVRQLGFTTSLGLLRLSIRDCTGAVTIDKCAFVPGPAAQNGGKIIVSNCDQVILHDCQADVNSLTDATIDTFNSNLVVDACEVSSTAITIRQGGGHLQINNSTLRHADGLTLGAALLFMAGGTAAVNGNSVFDGGQTAMVAAGAGEGSITLDPNTTFTNIAQQAFDPAMTLETRSIPGLDAMTQGFGGTASATLQVPANGMGFLFVGLESSPSYYPGIVDPIWFTSGVLEAVGSAPTITGDYAVPNATWVRGLALRWQGFVLDQNGEVAASNPSSYVHY